MATLLAIERYLPPYRYEQSVVTEWVRRWLEAGPRRSPSTRLLSSTTRPACRASERRADRGGLRSRRTSRRRTAATGRSPAGRPRSWPPAPSRRRACGPAEIDLVVSVSCTGFMIPSLDAHVANALRHRAAARPAADHRVRLRGRRRRTGARLRPPGRPPRPGRARPRRGALQPHLPALGPLGRERGLDRDLRRRRRGRRAGRGRHPRPRPRARCASAPRAAILPRHAPTSWASSCATPACRSCSTRGSRRSCGARCAGRRRLPRRAGRRPRPRSAAGSCTPAGGA